MNKDLYEKVRAKNVLDKVTFQKWVEVLAISYVRGSKEIDRLMKKYADEKYLRKTRHNPFTEVEEMEILARLEQESPLSDEIFGDDKEDA